MDLQITEFKTIIELLKAFPDEQTCINHLEKLRWDGVVISPFDETSKVYKCAGNKYKCKNSGKYFNVRTATIFEDTKVPLQKWFMALYIFSSHKKGISSHQLARDIGITQKSAWFLLMRLRYAFNHPTFREVLGDIVELDETYIGGLEKNKHANKKTKGTQGRSIKTKKPVFGMLERSGNIIAKVVDDTYRHTLEPIIADNVQSGTNVMTDEYYAYNRLQGEYEHRTVNHGAKQYVVLKIASARLKPKLILAVFDELIARFRYRCYL
jgi:transposase-like protein